MCSGTVDLTTCFNVTLLKADLVKRLKINSGNNVELGFAACRVNLAIGKVGIDSNNVNDTFLAVEGLFVSVLPY